MGEPFERVREGDRTLNTLQLSSTQAIYLLGYLSGGTVQRDLIMSDGNRNEKKHDIYGFL